jgi:Uma2 family endonuclease
MNILATKPTFTPDDLLAMPDEDRYELVAGHLVERQMGSESSYVGGRLFARLAVHCDQHTLGWVWPADTGYQCSPNTPNQVRKPDVSFVRAGRLPGGKPARGYEKLAPDLAAEVVSPNDLAEEIEQKVDDYLRAGVRLVWVLYPATKSVHVFRPDGSARRLRETDTLEGEDVVPGFTCPVAELFSAPPPPATP